MISFMELRLLEEIVKEDCEFMRRSSLEKEVDCTMKEKEKTIPVTRQSENFNIRKWCVKEVIWDNHNEIENEVMSKLIKIKIEK